ncbi:MAG: hypothetical protein GWN84_11980, partial [Gammaproteobacteria bacterium]|nr:hypothetical protein [Gammaproteobacteria bacterium]NIR85106.1 hypothetical protein [Gammaproteobacteria bacterium]NIU06155.1 hypothetical protein [Gammaproteobacteria bacterium]NIV51790.1 hypothetical protein [Gammaproteobacteria bacterium]NIX87428.1 hypothetical protein [Gammaproteobacteria bacterium]
MADHLESLWSPSDWGPVQGGWPDIASANPPIPPARKFTRENCPCLRDCRHYFSSVSHFAAGNADALDYEPTQRHHYCKAIPGVFLELAADSPVYACNHWDPQPQHDLVAMQERRRQWV